MSPPPAPVASGVSREDVRPAPLAPEKRTARAMGALRKILTCSTLGGGLVACSEAGTAPLVTERGALQRGAATHIVATHIAEPHGVLEHAVTEHSDHRAPEHGFTQLGAADSSACGRAFLPIPSIQGRGSSSPYRGEEVTTEGIVVGSFQGAERLRGFFLQDPTGDGDPETSDGVFVFDGDGGALGERTEGERLRVTGVVSEYFGQTQLTQLRAVTSCGRGSVPISPFEGPLELDRLEAIEGMRVRFEQPLTVVDSWGLGSYGELLLAVGGRPWWGEEPGLLGSLVLDDGSDRRDPRPVPYLSGERTVRLGDRVVGLEGVLGFAYGHFRVQPTGVVAFEERNARPPAPPRVGGLRIVTLNLDNYFVDLGSRGAADEEELALQRSKLARTILALNPDIAGLVELQNDRGAATEDLLAALATERGGTAYGVVPLPPLGGDAIRVGIVYAKGRVTPLGAPLFSRDPVHLRPPVAQTFAWGTRRLTVAVAHFKSRRCSGASGADLEGEEGCFAEQRRREARSVVGFLREAQRRAGDSALVLVGDLNAYPGEGPLEVLTAAGLSSLPAGALPTGALPAGALPASPGFDDAGRAPLYSYVFEGRAGLIDHVLGTGAVEARLLGGGVWHVNADEPAVLRTLALSGERPEEWQTPYRSSDHDPVYVDLGIPEEEGCGAHLPGRPAGGLPGDD